MLPACLFFKSRVDGFRMSEISENNEIIRIVGDRAGNLFDAGGFCCSESLLLVLNQGFDGGLAPEAVVSMGAGFCEGMGGAGCTCGSLSGAVMGLGLLLGPHCEKGLRKKEFAQLVRQMHDRFREQFGATCCRVLSKKVRHDKKLRFENCKMLTMGAAEIAAEILLEARPEFADNADREFLSRRDSKIGGRLKKLFGKI